MENIQRAEATGPIERVTKGPKSSRGKVKIPAHLLTPETDTDTRPQAERGLENFLRLEEEARIKVLEGRLVELDKVIEAGK